MTTLDPDQRAARPKNAVVVLLDSLNRRMVGAYGDVEFDTPNLDRLAARSVRFERHYAGSLPCMPARHDILVGALDFLWRPWGSIEVWEQSVVRSLTIKGVTTALVSDHPHLFETGGENYHTDFDAWEYQRGHESDPWRTRPDPSWLGSPALPAVASTRHLPYDLSRTWFLAADDFPGPRTMKTAAEWLELNGAEHDRFFLFIDEFDPHEPFDTPEPWASLYDPGWDGPKIIWPPYSTATVANGVLTEREAKHVRANYGSKLGFIDHWLGRLLDVMDRQDLWRHTAVILCTDHGHYLGERDLFGKPAVPIFPEMGQIPLMVAWPGAPAGTLSALTTSVDINATICDIFGVSPGDHRTHGRSLVPLLTKETTEVRDHLLSGIWGRHVQVIDRDRMYARAPAGDNFPLAMWSNRWSTMPAHGLPEARLPRPDGRARLVMAPGSQVPVIRQPFAPGDMLPFWGWGAAPDDHHLYDLADDPGAQHNIAGTRAESDAVELLRVAMSELEAPTEQFERLGIT
ncbi:MAG: sulfatase [Acidimicrobiales bacterium]